MSRAIVVGGSIAGMCAARVLCDHFKEVVLVDRDVFPSEVATRSGIPQSRHAHALLGRGQDELERLFPGFVAAMTAGGALLFDPGSELAMRRSLGWQDVGPHGFDTLWASRDLIEHTVRSRLRAHGLVELRERTSALGLRCADNAPRRVTGLRVRSEGAGEQVLDADLVVDASGRHSHAERWLQEHGLPLPDTQRVDAHAGYASRFYRPPPRERRPKEWWWKGLWIEYQPDTPRGAVIFPIEDDRWLVTAVGIAGNYPPTDEAGFLAFLETLSSRSIARAVALASPLSDIAGNRSMANVFRRYDRWDAELRGFVALGDAVCAFNPIYGQGMSTAAASAGLLADVLRERGKGPGLERAFFARSGAFLADVWNLATGADFQWPSTEGDRPRVPPAIGAYLRIAMEAGHFDAALRRQIVPVFNLTGSLKLFFEPRFAARALAAAARRRLRARLGVTAYAPDLPPAPA
jgi:2-polyprenyl-6-methoxyphenol hydroxylase-like FAD-dependent oxidoreductase